MQKTNLSIKKLVGECLLQKQIIYKKGILDVLII